eukprot:m51a1_g375 hypothetical protein (324) ;mRNA; r:641266-642447
MFWYQRFRAEIVDSETAAAAEDGTGDDMLFFVRDRGETPAGGKPPAADDVFVKRRGTTAVPFDSDIHWQKTYLLNMLTHQLVFTITVLVCHNDSEDPRKEYKVLRRVQKQVYSSPMRLRLDRKAQQAEPSFPLIHFAIADFDDAWKDIVINTPGHFVAVDLSISGRAFGVQLAGKQSVFRGGLGYRTITKAYADRGKQWWWLGQRPPATLSSLLPQALRPKDEQFLDIRGPGGKGRVQMAFAPAQGSQSAPAVPAPAAPAPGAAATPALACMLTFVCMPYDVLVADVLKCLDAHANHAVSPSPRGVVTSPAPDSTSHCTSTQH